jgi:hypothetical protein
MRIAFERSGQLKPLRGEGALDILICSEKRWPLRSTPSLTASAIAAHLTVPVRLVRLT